MSYADVEASLVYSRRIYGKHVELIDDGSTPNPTELVQQMDDHIRMMSDLLGQPVPQGRSVWVRGPLLWFDGRAIVSWAICDTQNAKLDHLDRHEVAHTLIMRLCGPDNDPSSLLAEGWAEFQSSSIKDMIRGLKEIVDRGDPSSLMELVSSEYYDRPIGAMYSHGGPLVAYLIERYGAETFFELYRDVRPPTFLKDSQRILGDSWSSVETDFWQWLDAEAERRGLVAEPSLAPGTIMLSDSVNRDKWETVVRANRESRSQMSKWPKDIALQVDFNRSGKRVDKIEAVRENEDVWLRSQHFDSQYTEFIEVTSSHKYALFRDKTGVLRILDAGTVGVSNIEEYISDSVQSIPTDYLGMAELGRILPLNEGEQLSHARINSLEQLEEPDSLWRLRCEVMHGEGQPTILDIQLDSALNWNVRRYVRRMSDNTEYTVEFEFAEFLGKTIATKRITTEPNGEISELVIRGLDETVAEEVRESVNSAARQGPLLERTPMSELILRPQYLTIVWPTCGLCLWLLGRRRRREGADN